MTPARPAPLAIRQATDRSDWDWLAQLWRTEWGGETMVSRETTHRLVDLAALIAWDAERRVGAATYRIADSECELMSLNALDPLRGVGSQLLHAVEQIARESGCQRVWLITTNDNVAALRFYQRRGYRIVDFHPGAVDRARNLKPEISLIGENDIPIHDEIELAKAFA